MNFDPENDAVVFHHTSMLVCNPATTLSALRLSLGQQGQFQVIHRRKYTWGYIRFICKSQDFFGSLEASSLSPQNSSENTSLS